MKKLVLGLIIGLVLVGFMSFALAQSQAGVNSNIGNQGEKKGISVAIRAGETIRIQSREINIEKNQERIRLRLGDVEVETELEVEKEEGEETKLKTQLSNGRNAEIKIMPDTANERALERLRLKVCSEENNCTIQLKEVGTNVLAYELQAERHTRILGLFQAKMQVRAQIDAESGEVIGVGKPWWAFLAS